MLWKSSVHSFNERVHQIHLGGTSVTLLEDAGIGKPFESISQAKQKKRYNISPNLIELLHGISQKYSDNPTLLFKPSFKYDSWTYGDLSGDSW